MLTRLFHPNASIITPVKQSNLYFMPAREESEFHAECDELGGPYATGLGCIRGLRYALAIEGAAAVFAVGVWSAWHLLR